MVNNCGVERLAGIRDLKMRREVHCCRLSWAVGLNFERNRNQLNQCTPLDLPLHPTSIPHTLLQFLPSPHFTPSLLRWRGIGGRDQMGLEPMWGAVGSPGGGRGPRRSLTSAVGVEEGNLLAQDGAEHLALEPCVDAVHGGVVDTVAQELRHSTRAQTGVSGMAAAVS